MTTRGGDSYTADGDLADALASGWSFAGDLGQYAYFTNGHAVPVLTVHPAPGRSIGDASVRALSGPAVEPTSATVNSPNGVEVVRSVTSSPVGVPPGTPIEVRPGRSPSNDMDWSSRWSCRPVGGSSLGPTTHRAVTCGIALTLVGIGGLCVLLGWSSRDEPEASWVLCAKARTSSVNRSQGQPTFRSLPKPQATPTPAGPDLSLAALRPLAGRPPTPTQPQPPPLPRVLPFRGGLPWRRPRSSRGGLVPGSVLVLAFSTSQRGRQRTRTSNQARSVQPTSPASA